MNKKIYVYPSNRTGSVFYRHSGRKSVQDVINILKGYSARAHNIVFNKIHVRTCLSIHFVPRVYFRNKKLFLSFMRCVICVIYEMY